MELQLPSAHEWSGMFWYWDYVMTTKMMAEGSLRESKDQLEAVKAQMEVREAFFCFLRIETARAVGHGATAVG